MIIVELSNSDYVNTVKMLHRLLDVTSFCAVEQWPTNISGLIPMVKDRITKLSLGMKEEDREKSIAEALESLKNERPKRISKQMLIELGTIKSKGMTGVLHMSQYTTARANSNQLLSILYTIDSQNYKVELMTEEIIILKYMMENMDSKYKSPIIDVLVRERLSEKRGALSEMKDFVNNYIGAMIRSDRDFKQSEKLTDRVKELVRKAFSIEINRNHLSGK